MKQKSKMILLVTAAALATTSVVTVNNLRADDKAAAATAPAKKGDDLLDPVIVKGAGIELKRSALDDAIARVSADARAHGQQISASDMPTLERLYLDQLLQVELLNAKASATEKASGKAEGDKRMDTILKNAPSPELLKLKLQALNLTQDGLHQQLVQEATANAVLRDRITPVTDADIKKFYDENPAKFKVSEHVRASHILIGTGDPNNPLTDDQKQAKRKLAEDILKRAKAGEDFAKLAKEYSDDPGSKDKGGEYVFGHGEMVPEFEAAAFSLQTNQVSDIVTTRYGYHIIKLSEKIPARTIALTEVTKDIKGYLEDAAMQKILPDVYVSLKKEAKVEFLDEHLKKLEEMPLDLPKAGSTPAQ